MLNLIFGQKNRLRSLVGERGFTIPEVLVGIVIITGVTVAGSRMFKDQKLAQKKVEYDAALTAFHNTVSKHLQNANNCNATLRGYYGLTGAAINASAPPAAIYTCTGCTATDVDYDANAISIPDSARTLWLQPGQWIENTNGATNQGTRTWRIESWSFIVPGTTGKGGFRIMYKLNPDLPYGGRSVNKLVTLPLRFSRVSPAVFRECMSSNESSVNNLQNDVCNSMTSQFGSTGVIMQWNDATQKCERVGASSGTPVKDCASTGQIVEGIRSDGSVHCKSIGDGVVPGEDLMLQSPCPPGGSIKLEIVDGKVVTTCL
jgi:prepilin-type N-terminal cleavage/methylation domain-containing protein